jgi:ferredoxin
MTEFVILPENRRVSAEAGESMLDAALRHGVPLSHACGGKAQCSTCRIAIVEGITACATRNSTEQALAERLGFAPGIRLACQTPATPGAVVRRLVLDDDDTALATQPLLAGQTDAVGTEIDAAILFSDIRGFTRMSRPWTA